MGVWAFGDVTCNKQKVICPPPSPPSSLHLKLLDPPLQNVLLLKRYKSIVIA